jgi:Domain of Unknown Function with PDB structure (DUF3857)/Transglutaminase-like superfamily
MRCLNDKQSRPFVLFCRQSSIALLIAAASLCSTHFASAQDQQDQPEPMVVKVPAFQPTAPSIPAKPSTTSSISKEALVFDQARTRIRMESDGTGTRETTTSVRILADAGVKAMAVLEFTYTASNQQVDIDYVRVKKPDGTVIVTPDYNTQDMPADVSRLAPMYSDIHEKHVAVKALGVGDILEFQTTLRTLKPEVPGQFWLEYSFEKNLIMLDEQLDLDLPADKAATVASADVQPSVTASNGRKLYHWASSNLSRPDPDAPPKSTKHVKPSVQVTTFTSWDQVGAWYQSLQQSSLVVTPAIQTKAAALTAGLTSDEDKVRAIFNEVALHIHYVGLEFGIGRYQPHPADDVLSNEYGDCKDKHTLLATLLKAAGIEAWPVLISATRELDPATPSPAQFNHVITVVPHSGKLLWMDSTEEVAPVGELLQPLRDKQALVIPSAKAAFLDTTPANLPRPSSTRIEIAGKLSEDGQFRAHMTESLDGDAGILLRAVFRQVPQSQWKELLQRVASTQGYGGEISNPLISAIEQTSQPITFAFDYTREKFNRWDDHKRSHWIDPPLPAIGGELAPGIKEKKPADDPELGSIGETVYLATIQPPPGWSITTPQNVDLKEDWGEYKSIYKLKDGALLTERRMIIRRNKVPLDQWDEYLAFRRAMYQDWTQQSYISPLKASLPSR